MTMPSTGCPATTLIREQLKTDAVFIHTYYWKILLLLSKNNIFREQSITLDALAIWIFFEDLK
jgi:hypothetical protein